MIEEHLKKPPKSIHDIPALAQTKTMKDIILNGMGVSEDRCNVPNGCFFAINPKLLTHEEIMNALSI